MVGFLTAELGRGEDDSGVEKAGEGARAGKAGGSSADDEDVDE